MKNWIKLPLFIPPSLMHTQTLPFFLFLFTIEMSLVFHPQLVVTFYYHGFCVFAGFLWVFENHQIVTHGCPCWHKNQSCRQPKSRMEIHRERGKKGLPLKSCYIFNYVSFSCWEHHAGRPCLPSLSSGNKQKSTLSGSTV